MEEQLVTLEGVLRLLATAMAAWLAYGLVDRVRWGVLWAKWSAHFGESHWFSADDLLPVFKRIVAFLITALIACVGALLLIVLDFEPAPESARAWIITLSEYALRAFFLNHTLHTVIDLPSKGASPGDAQEMLAAR